MTGWGILVLMLFVAVNVVGYLVVRSENRKRDESEAAFTGALEDIKTLSERLTLMETDWASLDDKAEYIERLTRDYKMYLKDTGRGGDWTIDEFMDALNTRAKYILKEVRK